MTDLEHFQQAVEQFIADKGMTPTEFGKQFAGDPLFVFQLRKGREPRTATRQRVLAAIQGERAA